MKERAKERRRNMTDAENRMWYYLRNRRLGGYKFIREHVIGNYIADFVCREKKLIIEIDGGQHMDAIMYDSVRTNYLESCGYRVLRIWNDEVFKNIQGVMDSILQLLKTIPNQAPSSPTLLPQGRRELIVPTE
jgi:very-short-patch-repair endonuclease